MTTNVFDKAAAMLATDSRWSRQITHAVIYLDDVPFEKIVLDLQLAFMFAGDADRIREWKVWIAHPGRSVMNSPSVEGKGLALCIIDLELGEVVFERNQEIRSEEAFFAGTGAIPAHSCWTINKDPRRAVETAKFADRYSGGTVKTLDLKSRVHNLMTEELDSLRLNILDKGMVMYFNNPPHIPLRDAMATDSEVAKAVDKILNGSVSMTAPSPSAENEWSLEDKDRLHAVLGRYYPSK